MCTFINNPCLYISALLAFLTKLVQSVALSAVYELGGEQLNQCNAVCFEKQKKSYSTMSVALHRIPQNLTGRFFAESR